MDVVIDPEHNDATVLEVSQKPSGVDLDVTVPKPVEKAPTMQQQIKPASQPRIPFVRPSLPQRPLPRPPQPAPSRDFFMDIANPAKVSKPKDGDEFDDASSFSISEAGDEELRDLPDNDQESALGSEYQVEEPEEDEEAYKPSKGFRTIEEEKSHLVLKLQRLKSMGVNVPRVLGMQSDIRELRSEYARVKAQRDLDDSIRFQRKMLGGVVTALEFMNRRYDPFDFQLDGWSEHVNGSISDYDNVFERLHEKYKAKVSMAPEIELILMLAGSALTFHLTKVIVKNLTASVTNPATLAGGAPDPGVMMQLLGGMLGGGGSGGLGGGGVQAAPTQAEQRASAPAQATQASTPGSQPAPVREMKPPAFDLGNLMGSIGVIPPPQISSDISLPPRERRVTFEAPPTSSPVVTAASKRPAPTPEPEEDRVSDVVSDDLESVPDDMMSISSDPQSSKTVRGRKRTKTQAPKNVIKI